MSPPNWGLVSFEVKYWYNGACPLPFTTTLDNIGKVTLYFVEQNFAMASRLGDHCYVMDDGRTVHAGPMAALAADQALKRRYLGV